MSVPDLLQVRGVDALLCSFPPLHDLTADVGVRFRWGEKSFVAPSAANLPVDLAQLTDPGGWVRFTGIRLSPIPTKVAPQIHWARERHSLRKI